MLLTVVFLGIGPIGGQWRLLFAMVPLAMFVVLAIRRIPFWLVGLAVLPACPAMHWRGLVVLVPVALLQLLRVTSRFQRQMLFKPVAVGSAVVLAVLVVAWFDLERSVVKRYRDARWNAAANPSPISQEALARTRRLAGRVVIDTTSLHHQAAVTFRQAAAAAPGP